jgi:MFS family permease
MVPGFLFITLGLIFLAWGAHWQWSVASFVTGFFWIHGGQAVTAGSMQVLGSDMAPAAARGHFFGFWRQIGQIISPAIFAFAAEHIAYSAAFSIFAVSSIITAALLAFSVKEPVGRGDL